MEAAAWANSSNFLAQLNLEESDASFVSGVIEFMPKRGDFGDVKPKRVRLFIKPYCAWCHRATRWLSERGIEFETVDVTSDETAYDEMIRLSGQELAPVIEVDGKVLADFGPEELSVFWGELQPQMRAPAHG